MGISCIRLNLLKAGRRRDVAYFKLVGGRVGETDLEEARRRVGVAGSSTCDHRSIISDVIRCYKHRKLNALGVSFQGPPFFGSDHTIRTS